MIAGSARLTLFPRRHSDRNGRIGKEMRHELSNLLDRRPQFSYDLGVQVPV